MCNQISIHHGYFALITLYYNVLQMILENHHAIFFNPKKSCDYLNFHLYIMFTLDFIFFYYLMTSTIIHFMTQSKMLV